MRSTLSRSRASHMYSGGPSSPACATVRKPSLRARSKTRWNLLGGCPTSELSRPTAMKASRNGSAWSRVFCACSSLRWRRKLRISPWQLLAVLQRGADAGEHHLEGNAAIGVGLRVEERLDVDDVLRLALLQVGPGQVVEVLLGAQHVGAGVVKVEEFLQVVEGVGLAQGLDVVPGQGDAVALGEGEQQLRLQGTFQVQVQFGLGQGVEPFVHGVGSRSGWSWPASLTCPGSQARGKPTSRSRARRAAQAVSPRR